MVKTKSGWIALEPAPDQSDCHLDSNGVNDSQTWARMEVISQGNI